MSDLVADIPVRFAVAAAVGGIFFLLYFSIDIYLFLTKRHFGRVNIELVYFTRDDNSTVSSDALHFRTIVCSVFLKQAYDNRYLFWRMIIKTLKATPEDPVVDFRKHAYAALVPFRDRVAERCAVGEVKRALGGTFIEQKHRIVVVNDRSEDKRRFILKVLVIKEGDLRNVDLENLPKAGKNRELFIKVVRAFEKKPRAFLPVQLVSPA